MREERERGGWRISDGVGEGGGLGASGESAGELGAGRGSEEL